MATKDYSLLEKQPLSAADLHTAECLGIVISAIIDEHGGRTVISRYSDDVWALWPFFEQSNRAGSEKFIDWNRLPEEFREVLKAILYRYWMVGRPGGSRPVAGTLRDAFVRIAVFLRFLRERGVHALRDVTSLHVANFVQLQKDKGQMNSQSLKTQLACVELLHIFRDQHPDQLRFELWGDASCQEVAGFYGKDKVQAIADSRTPLIPQPVVATLFTFAEQILEGADQLLNERDKGTRPAFKDPDLLLVRDACFFLLGILTGMRCDELVGIEVGAGRTETKDGFVYNWIKSIEHKTKKGKVEYLVAAMGLRILRVMERWSEPHRERLANELAELESLGRFEERAEHAERIHALRVNRHRLFQGSFSNLAVSGRSWGNILKAFALQAGVSWDLSPHQLRRTYAWTFVRHKLGNILLLKEQFKHSSLEMTQLYAANPMQDETLYDECLTELYEYRVEIVQRWLQDGELLSGGAGKKIIVMRAHTFPDRAAMIKETADKVSIRSTGHSWCLSQLAAGCGGQGLYERTHCVNCASGVIDATFQPVWQEIYEHQLELRQDASCLGPGAKQRVERDIARSRQVLTDLGATGLVAS